MSETPDCNVCECGALKPFHYPGCLRVQTSASPVPAPADQAETPAQAALRELARAAKELGIYATEPIIAEQAETPKKAIPYVQNWISAGPDLSAEPPENVCDHGQLARSCDRCEMQQEIAALRDKVETLKAARHADRDRLKAQIEKERESLRSDDPHHSHYDEGFDAALAWVVSLLDAPREETQK